MDAGNEVICLDNFFTGSKQNIVRWINHVRFELVRHDVVEVGFTIRCACGDCVEILCRSG